MKLKKLSAMALAAAMVISTVGCGAAKKEEAPAEPAAESAAAEETAAEETAEAPAADGEVTGITIGFSNCSQDTPFFANMTPIIQDYAASLNRDLKVVALNADNDITKQNQDIQDLVSQKIDVLIVNPVNEDGPSAGIEACNTAGIPIVTVDKNVKSGYDVWVGRDNVTMGRLCGERLIELLDGKSGTILEIQGTAGSTTMMQRRDGFHEAVEKVEGLKIVQSSYCDYDRSKAIPATQDLLQANNDIVAIYGHNDDMALGAAQVCAEKGLNDVLVCGVDGLMEAVLQIKDGKYACTTSNDPVLLGQTAVDVALKLLAGEKVDDFIDAGTVVIDPSNVDEYANPDLDFATMVK